MNLVLSISTVNWPRLTSLLHSYVNPQYNITQQELIRRWDTRMWHDVSSYLFTYLPLNFEYTVNRKTHQNVFWYKVHENLTDCDKILYILSWVNLSYRNVNVFSLTWIVSLPYLVNLHYASKQQLELWTKKTHEMFLSYLLQNETDSDKVWYRFFWLGCPTYMSADLCFTTDFFFFLSFFIRLLISGLAERNSTISGHMVGSKCDLKMHVRNVGYHLPLKTGAPKPPSLDDFAT